MPDHIVDTNVLCAASTADMDSHYADTDHVPSDELGQVLDWLMAFRADSSRSLVLDDGDRLMSEYRGQLGGNGENNIGMRVIYEKWNTARLVSIPTDVNGRVILPDLIDQAYNYRGDRNIIALALADRTNSTVVNACDTDWYDWEDILQAHGIVVDQIIGNWCRADWERKRLRERR